MSESDAVLEIGGTKASKSAGGTSPTYLVARLKRDAPEIAERFAAGEFRSVRAAAVAAGIIKEEPSLAVLKRAWRRASFKERAAFLTWCPLTRE